MAELKIDDDTARDMLRELLEKHITPEKRDELVRDAIASLLTRERFGDKTKLQQAMSAAAYDVCEAICREEFDRPETRDKIREVFSEAWEQLMGKSDRRDKLVEQMSGTLGEALFGRGY
jgi:hypothetical protein